MKDTIGKPWNRKGRIRKILVLRFQAIGDVVITLPYLQSLKESQPDLSLHFMTRRESAEIPSATSVFERVIVIGGGRNVSLQFLHVMLFLPWLWWQQYDAVIDLQNHWISRLIRKLVIPSVWSEFDRSSHRLAGIRTKEAIDFIGLTPVSIPEKIEFTKAVDPISILSRHGWDGKQPLVVLNPAGAFASRHWGMERFVTFARLWQQAEPETLFLALGLITMKDRTKLMSQALGKSFLDLCGKTTAVEAFSILREAKLVLTEDSGLMHMAWVQRVPTMALMGSSPAYWSAPMGPHSICLHSGDLDCGHCLLENCKYGDNRCLIRYTPGQVCKLALELSKSIS